MWRRKTILTIVIINHDWQAYVSGRLTYAVES